MFGFLGQLFTGKANTEEVGGPISIIVFMNEAAKTGFISAFPHCNHKPEPCYT